VSARKLALAWGAALILAIGAGTALTRRGTDRATPAAAPPATLPAAPVVVIGSSLMAHAVPWHGDGHHSLLGDGRAHVRWAIGAISEAQTLQLVAGALQRGARTVLVEVHPLAFDFAFATPAHDVRPLALANTVLQESRLAATGLRRLLKLSPTPAPRQARLDGEPDTLDRPFETSPRAFAYFYPLHLREPADAVAWAALVQRAREQDAAIILVAPPRSRSAADAMGAAAGEALQRHLKALAQELGVPMFQPGPVWPDDHFIDHAHMNRQGRARFMQELARWRAGAP
jgi:hypothetical protein